MIKEVISRSPLLNELKSMINTMLGILKNASSPLSKRLSQILLLLVPKYA